MGDDCLVECGVVVAPIEGVVGALDRREGPECGFFEGMMCYGLVIIGSTVEYVCGTALCCRAVKQSAEAQGGERIALKKPKRL